MHAWLPSKLTPAASAANREGNPASTVASHRYRERRQQTKTEGGAHSPAFVMCRPRASTLLDRECRVHAGLVVAGDVADEDVLAGGQALGDRAVTARRYVQNLARDFETSVGLIDGAAFLRQCRRVGFRADDEQLVHY